MKIPMMAPTIDELMVEYPNALTELFSRGIGPAPDNKYRHWDTLRHITPPEGLSHKLWWFAIKGARSLTARPLPLEDVKGIPFKFGPVDPMLRYVHEIDKVTGHRVAVPKAIATTEARDRYLQSSLIEEAITSSQLEGAATTREQGKEMIRSGRKPVDNGERMILNNYRAVQLIGKHKAEPLSIELIQTIQRILTEDTLEDPRFAGAFRRDQDPVHVIDHEGNVLHTPPPARELDIRLRKLCEFANTEQEQFVHPVVKAIVLHFWLAYEHPFVDGNGRTARAIFYWSMLNAGYWLFEFISISSILKKAPARYGRAFLYTETDANDLNYFILHQLGVIERAIKELHHYLDRKSAEISSIESRLKRGADLNYRQIALLGHALRHPGFDYTIQSHKASHRVAYQTARTDLYGLESRGLLKRRKRGNKYVFSPVSRLDRKVLQKES